MLKKALAGSDFVVRVKNLEKKDLMSV